MKHNGLDVYNEDKIIQMQQNFMNNQQALKQINKFNPLKNIFQGIIITMWKIMVHRKKGKKKLPNSPLGVYFNATYYIDSSI